MHKMQRDSKGRFIKKQKEDVKEKIVTPSNKENKPECLDIGETSCDHQLEDLQHPQNFDKETDGY